MKISMMLFQVLSALVFFSGCREQPSDSSKSSGGHAAPDTFSVAFYNVENLFDDEFDGREYVEYRPEATNWGSEMFRRKLQNIASVIRAMDASVIALCEVEDMDVIEQLRRVLREKGIHYPYLTIADSHGESNTRPAILSRYPVKRSASYPVLLSGGLVTRDILEADIDVMGKSLRLFVNHWPSKRHPESYRLTVAKILAKKLSELPPQTDYIILGDLNSDYDEFSTFTSFGKNNTRGVTGINHRLGTIVTEAPGVIRFRTDKEVAEARFPAHYDLWLELPSRIRMSYFYRGNNQTPDHILLPPSLFDATGISYVDNSFQSFTWGSRLLSHGKPNRWRIYYYKDKKYHAGEGYSDHLPILARFSVRPFQFIERRQNGYAGYNATSNSPQSWFEYHTNGWIALGNRTRYIRDTTKAYAGRYALYVVADAHRKNTSIMRTVIGGRHRKKNGDIHFVIRGSGDICFRTRAPGKKWLYYNIIEGTSSGTAAYPSVNFSEWHTVVLSPKVARSNLVELELRVGKEMPLNLWIDR